MQHIITDEEVTKLWNIYNESCNSSKEATKEALTDFLNNRPQVAQLRPIAEMSEKPPEGCFRMYWLHTKEGWGWVTTLSKDVTHFMDFLPPTPDPDAEERRQFEEAMKKAFPLTSFVWSVENDGYKELDTESAWQGWKLAKKGGDK